jgi:hypothetical protein
MSHRQPEQGAHADVCEALRVHKAHHHRGARQDPGCSIGADGNRRPQRYEYVWTGTGTGTGKAVLVRYVAMLSRGKLT